MIRGSSRDRAFLPGRTAGFLKEDQTHPDPGEDTRYIHAHATVARHVELRRKGYALITLRYAPYSSPVSRAAASNHIQNGGKSRIETKACSGAPSPPPLSLSLDERNSYSPTCIPASSHQDDSTFAFPLREAEACATPLRRKSG